MVNIPVPFGSFWGKLPGQQVENFQVSHPAQDPTNSCKDVCLMNETTSLLLRSNKGYTNNNPQGSRRSCKTAFIVMYLTFKRKIIEIGQDIVQSPIISIDKVMEYSKKENTLWQPKCFRRRWKCFPEAFCIVVKEKHFRIQSCSCRDSC